MWLIVDLGRWLENLTPEWIALEQVPAVLPLWRAYADLLRDRGYSVWTGILNAADFGVPQTRRRAILIASRTRIVHPPQPTHAETPTVSLFGTVEPWVTMAAALGWGMNERPGYTLAVGARSGGADVSGADVSGARAGLRREAAEGRWTLNTGRDWPAGGTREDAQTVDAETSPSPTVTTMAGRQWQIANDWTFERPATTIAGAPRLGAPGHRDREGGERQFGPDAIRLTIRDALILQSFREDYPVQGTKTRQFEQIGNAIPPLLALRILEAVLPVKS